MTEILEELNASIADKEEDLKYIEKLNNTVDKVKYLRLIKKYTQSESAALMGISTRHVRRLEKKIKKIWKCPQKCPVCVLPQVGHFMYNIHKE